MSSEGLQIVSLRLSIAVREFMGLRSDLSRSETATLLSRGHVGRYLSLPTGVPFPSSNLRSHARILDARLQRIKVSPLFLSYSYTLMPTNAGTKVVKRFQMVGDQRCGRKPLPPINRFHTSRRETRLKCLHQTPCSEIAILIKGFF